MLPWEWWLWDSITIEVPESMGRMLLLSDPCLRRMLARLLAGAVLACGAGGAATAFEAGLPADAEQTAARVEALGSYALPIGPWADGSMLTRRTEGRVEQSAWRTESGAEQTLALLAPLRAALLAEGWRILFECDSDSCGGFDFRYSTQVLPEPAMHVDLADFRFLSARRGAGEAEQHVSLLVSRSSGAGAGYLQLIRVDPPTAADQPAAAPGTGLRQPPADFSASLPRGDDSIAQALWTGTLVLEGVEFATGAADTASGGDALLAGIAAYLAAHPEQTLALVGHTDASGSLEVNVALSKRRAEAVRRRLISDFAVPAQRLTALGAGFMAPRDSNQTEDGRARNRRVEAMLTSTR